MVLQGTTSSDEFHERIQDFLGRLRPRVPADDWDRVIAPFAHVSWTDLLTNVVAVIRQRDIALNPGERDELNDLLDRVGVRHPVRQAAPVQQDLARHQP